MQRHFRWQAVKCGTNDSGSCSRRCMWPINDVNCVFCKCCFVWVRWGRGGKRVYQGWVWMYNTLQAVTATATVTLHKHKHRHKHLITFKKQLNLTVRYCGAFCARFVRVFSAYATSRCLRLLLLLLPLISDATTVDFFNLDSKITCKSN